MRQQAKRIVNNIDEKERAKLVEGDKKLKMKF